jgi:hypothetical protein
MAGTGRTLRGLLRGCSHLGEWQYAGFHSGSPISSDDLNRQVCGSRTDGHSSVLRVTKTNHGNSQIFHFVNGGSVRELAPAITGDRAPARGKTRMARVRPGPISAAPHPGRAPARVRRGPHLRASPIRRWAIRDARAWARRSFREWLLIGVKADVAELFQDYRGDLSGHAA